MDLAGYSFHLIFDPLTFNGDWTNKAIQPMDKVFLGAKMITILAHHQGAFNRGQVHSNLQGDP
jgi:hypothetical protein